MKFLVVLLIIAILINLSLAQDEEQRLREAIKNKRCFYGRYSFCKREALKRKSKDDLTKRFLAEYLTNFQDEK